MTEDYWFSRSSRSGSRRMAPANWKGWAVVAFFVASMLSGAGLFGYFMFQGRVLVGVTLYVFCAFMGAGTFIWLAHAKGDRTPRVNTSRERSPQEDLHDQLGGRR